MTSYPSRLRWLIPILAALLLAGCVPLTPLATSLQSVGERLRERWLPTIAPTPTLISTWTPRPPAAITPTPAATSTPLPKATPTPSPTPADLPVLVAGENTFRLLTTSGRTEWQIYGESLRRLKAREGQVFLVVDVELIGGANPLDLLLGRALGSALYLSDERQAHYPAVQALRSGRRATFVFSGLPVMYSGSLRLQLLDLPAVTFLPGDELAVTGEESAPHAPGEALALSRARAATPICSDPVRLSTLPTQIPLPGWSGGPAGPYYRLRLDPPGKGGAAQMDSQAVEALRVDARLVQGKSGSPALVFGVNLQGLGGSALLVDPQGRWAFSGAGFDGNWQTQREFARSPAVQLGAATNRLMVVAQNGMLALYANDIPLTSAFPQPVSGQDNGVGLISAGSETVIAEFSRFQHCAFPDNHSLPVQLADPALPERWPAETPMLLEYTWSANTLAQAAQFAGQASIRVQVDGRTAANPAQYWGQAAPLGGILSSGERSVIRWQAQLEALSPGSHHILFRLSLLQPVTSGIDADGDGKADTYGPGVVVEREFDFVVE